MESSSYSSRTKTNRIGGIGGLGGVEVNVPGQDLLDGEAPGGIREWDPTQEPPVNRGHWQEETPNL